MNFKLAALCAPGTEKILSNEIKKIAQTSNENLAITSTSFGRVHFECGLRGAYLSLMGLRSAERLLLELAEFALPEGERDIGDALFENSTKIEIENYIVRAMPLVIDKVRLKGDAVRSGRFAQAAVHKALAMRLCGKLGISSLPPFDTEAGEAAFIRVYIERRKALVMLDISGEPLYKRSYRAEGGEAPLRETTAAAVVLMTLWKRKYPLYDPFCGRGTIALEAFLYALNIAPNMAREFSISSFSIHDEKTKSDAWAFFKDAMNTGGAEDFRVDIEGSDKSADAVEAARRNLARLLQTYSLAQVPGGALPRFNVKDMKDAKASVAGNAQGCIITNPPYGKRLENRESAAGNYAAMRILRKNFPRWKIAVLSDNADFETLYGRRASRVSPLKRGAASLFLYEFAGEGDGAFKTDAARDAPHARCPADCGRQKSGERGKKYKQEYVW